MAEALAIALAAVCLWLTCLVMVQRANVRVTRRAVVRSRDGQWEARLVRLTPRMWGRIDEMVAAGAHANVDALISAGIEHIWESYQEPVDVALPTNVAGITPKSARLPGEADKPIPWFGSPESS